jgi:hypothetical protein
MNNGIIFFNYLSAFEEKTYHADATQLSDCLKVEVASNENLQSYERLMRKKFGISLFDELTECKLMGASTSCREAQFYINLSIFEIVKKELDIRAIAGYSAGYWQAALACRVYSLSYFDNVVHPILLEYRDSNFKHWMEAKLASVFISHPEVSDLNFQVKRIIAELGSPRPVFVKDDRPPYSVQIAGDRDAVDDVWQRVRAICPDVERYSTKVRRCDSAHIPVVSWAKALRRLEQTDPKPPVYPMVDPGGRVVTSDGWTNLIGARLLYDAAFLPLNMAHTAGGIRRLNVPVIAIGSTRVTKFSFYGLHDNERPESICLWRFSRSGECYMEPIRMSHIPDW